LRKAGACTARTDNAPADDLRCFNLNRHRLNLRDWLPRSLFERKNCAGWDSDCGPGFFGLFGRYSMYSFGVEVRPISLV
jgi:hypothetical protein